MLNALMERTQCLVPQYAELLRERDSLAGQAARSIAQKSNDNIRVVERASIPSKGKSLRRPVAAERTFDMPVLATVGLKRR